MCYDLLFEKTFKKEHLRLIYIQKDVFTSKQYEQFKQDLGFIVIDGVIGCKGRLVIVCYHSISNILHFFKNINLQS